MWGIYLCETDNAFNKKDTHSAIGKEDKKELMASPDFCDQPQLSIIIGGQCVLYIKAD